MRDPSSSSAARRPSVSVAMPTFNGERFIAQALDSLLAQTRPADEIVISDNASTDRTGDIAMEYAARHRQIRYIRQPKHVSAPENFRWSLQASHSELFMWAGDHDLWSTTYIESSARVLDASPECVLAFPETIQIDGAGKSRGIMRSTPESLAERRAYVRYHRLIWEVVAGNMIYGVIRRDALVRTTIGRRLIGADLLTLAELALMGPFVAADGATFYRREYRDETPTEFDARRLRSLGIGRADYRALRNAHLRAVIRSRDLSLTERVAAIRDTLRCYRERFGVRAWH